MRVPDEDTGVVMLSLALLNLAWHCPDVLRSRIKRGHMNGAWSPCGVAPGDELSCRAHLLTLHGFAGPCGGKCGETEEMGANGRGRGGGREIAEVL